MESDSLIKSFFTIPEFEELLTAEKIQKGLHHSNLEPFIEIFFFYNAGKKRSTYLLIFKEAVPAEALKKFGCKQ